MNVLVWVVQALLALVFSYSGSQKATRSKPDLITAGQTGVAPFPLRVVRFTAVCELAAAAGLILPWQPTLHQSSPRSLPSGLGS